MIHPQYAVWRKNATEDPDLQKELLAIEGKEAEINDRFYQFLQFGTAGLRGIIGAGTNRMNIYTVRRATKGLCDYLNRQKADDKSVAIGYDSRNKSLLFAKEAARVLAQYHIHAYLYSQLMPVPCVSFAVRELHCDMGIMITASHNPSQYNGYKVFGSDGCQIDETTAEKITKEIEKNDPFSVAAADFSSALSQGVISYIPPEVTEAYYQSVLAQSIRPSLAPPEDFKVVYTPLNGTGNQPVREVLRRIGVKTVYVVPSQELPDGNFPTCPSPNPEIREALEPGLALCREKKANLLLATDPDADRVGVAEQTEKGVRLFTGNETGCLLLDYILSQRKEQGALPADGLVVKSIVTTELASKIAAHYGVKLKNVLIGFKFVGDIIGKLEREQKEDRFLFGFEESYGCLAGSYVRDKDAVLASMLICEMAAFHASRGKSLGDVLDELFSKYGYHLCSQKSFAFEGEEGSETMRKMMQSLRQSPAASVAGFSTVSISDYQRSVTTHLPEKQETPLDFPVSDILEYLLDDGSRAVIRPSGTEPKIKIYFFVVRPTKEEAEKIEGKLKAGFEALLKTE